MALAYARLFTRGAVSSVAVSSVAGLRVVTGLPKRAYPRGGICIGDVFLTGSTPSTAVIRHELRHVEQWKRYGLWMPLFYALAGRRADRNWFEVDAGLEDGGYR